MNNSFIREIVYKNYKISKESMLRASKYVDFSGDDEQDFFIIQALENLRILALKGVKSDQVKNLVPESYLTNIVFTINFRSLMNFLRLRTSKGAHYRIRDLAYMILEQIPEKHKFLFEEIKKSSDI